MGPLVEPGRTFDALADHLPVARGGLFVPGRLGAGPDPLRLSVVRPLRRQVRRAGLLLRDLRAVPGDLGGHRRHLHRQPVFSRWSAAEPAALAGPTRAAAATDRLGSPTASLRQPAWQ